MRIKNIFITIMFFFLFIVFKPVNTYALVEKSSYINIEDKLDMEVADYLSVSLSFTTNNILDPTKANQFGLTGSIENKTFYDKNYSIKISYYDENYNLLLENKESKEIKAKCDNCYSLDNLVKLMSSVNKLKDKDISKINYYMVEIDIDTTSPNINSSYEYTINKYDINIKVNEDNTYDIEEKITAYFNIPKHGIYRTIPYKNMVTRLDNTKNTNVAKLTNLYVNAPYTLNKNYNNYIIQIGSSMNTIEGEKEYVIKYNYNIGNDKSKNYDEFYYNIIGTEWDTQISDITFSVTMPKEFDRSKLGFSKGEYSSVNTSDIEYKVDNNMIRGSYKGVLKPNEGLTIRLELPDGYFVKQKIDLKQYSMYLVPIICLIISLVIYFVLKNGINLVETIEFYPPLGLNSLELGLYYKGKAEGKEITSLLIYLANKGYLKINELDKKDYQEKGKYEIIKLKEELPDNEYEKRFLNYLFDGKNIVNEKNLFKDIRNQKNIKLFATLFTVIGFIVFIIGLRINKVNLTWMGIIAILIFQCIFCYYNAEKSYNGIYNILKDINSNSNTSNILRNKKGISIIINILMWISILAIIVSFLNFINIEINLMLLVLLLVVNLIFIESLKSVIYNKDSVSIIELITFMLIVIYSLNTFVFTDVYDVLYIIPYIIGLICILGMIIVEYKIIWRTSYGYEMLGKIKGFKRFLKTAEKDKLNALVNSNPNYFYDILPYTYVLGISNTWIKKFNKISIKNPEWYSSPLINGMGNFKHFFDSSMRDFYRGVPVYSVSRKSFLKSFSSGSSRSGSSGGSSGGGFSGGGSGGGGGGSW